MRMIRPVIIMGCALFVLLACTGAGYNGPLNTSPVGGTPYRGYTTPDYVDSRLAPIDDPFRVQIPGDPKKLSNQKIRQAITVGAAVKGWFVVVESEGRIELTTRVRNEHTVNVAVAFDATGYDIRDGSGNLQRASIRKRFGFSIDRRVDRYRIFI